MFARIRNRLFLVSVAIIGVSGAVAGISLRRAVRETAASRLLHELDTTVHAVAALLPHQNTATNAQLAFAAIASETQTELAYVTWEHARNGNLPFGLTPQRLGLTTSTPSENPPPPPRDASAITDANVPPPRDATAITDADVPPPRDASAITDANVPPPRDASAITGVNVPPARDATAIADANVPPPRDASSRPPAALRLPRTALPTASATFHSLSYMDAEWAYSVYPTSDDAHGAVIARRPKTEIGAAVARIDRIIVAAALAGLLIAMLMSWATTTLIGRALRRLTASARDVVRGNARRLADDDDNTRDELHDLRDWFNYLAEDAARNTNRLARERGLLTSVLDSMGQGVIALSATGLVEVFNEQARRILNLPASIVGELLASRVAYPELVELAGKPTSGQTEFALPSGTRVMARSAPMRDLGGIVIVLEDVTTVRELETIRQDFVANVSHELRTPVAVIRANAETLSGGAKDDPQFAGRLIDGLHRNAERLARILADLLDLSRLDAGHYRLETAPVSVALAIEHAVNAVEPLVKQRACQIHVAIAPTLTVLADAKALDQILVNLIDNAVKYGAAQGTVTISAESLAAGVRICVADDGNGLDAVHQKRVFERFYRADAHRSREAGGTGLGLAIVKHLVESMNGEVGVHSATPHGSVFWLVLPAAPANNA